MLRHHHRGLEKQLESAGDLAQDRKRRSVDRLPVHSLSIGCVWDCHGEFGLQLRLLVGGWAKSQQPRFWCYLSLQEAHKSGVAWHLRTGTKMELSRMRLSGLGRQNSPFRGTAIPDSHALGHVQVAERFFSANSVNEGFNKRVLKTFAELDGTNDYPAGSRSSRPRRSTQSKKYYFAQESETTNSTLTPFNADFVPGIVGMGALLGAGFVIFKMLSKRQSTTSAGSSGILPGIGGIGGEKKLRRESAAKLNDFSRELRTFREVDLSGKSFGDEGFIFLAEGLAFNGSAESVDFSANNITAEGIKALTQVIPTNTFLKTFNLSGNNIGDEGAQILATLLENNQGIQKLQLNSNNIGDEGAKALAELLKKNPYITTLELNNNSIDYAGFAAFGDALIANKTLRSLYLNGNYGGALGAAAFAKGLEQNKSLREVHLHGNQIGNEGVRTLMGGLMSHRGKVTSVDIGNNSIGPQGAFHVAELIKRSKSLMWLNLYMNDIGDQGAEKIGEALKRTKTLSTVDLGGNNIGPIGTSHIANAIKENVSITTLEFSYNPIGPDGAKVLSETLKFHGSIETLKLGWCQIGVKGAEYFAESLQYNSTISTLDLRANALGDDGAAAFARSLRVVNETLTSLDLGFNEIRDKGAFALAQALKANGEAAVSTLNLTSNFFTKYGQVALTEAKDHVSEMNDGKEVNIYF